MKKKKDKKKANPFGGKKKKGRGKAARGMGAMMNPPPMLLLTIGDASVIMPGVVSIHNLSCATYTIWGAHRRRWHVPYVRAEQERD